MWRIKLETYLALGLSNVARVGMYRLKKKLGSYRYSQPFYSIDSLHSPVFFEPPDIIRSDLPVNPNWQEEAKYFSHKSVTIDGSPPDWHQDPWSKKRLDNKKEWWRIADFNEAYDDIKVYWEASRFDWVLSFAQAAKAGDDASLQKLNTWLHNWDCLNPVYLGINWKCGQEASIRVMHLAMASLILDQAKDSSSALLSFIEKHLKRIGSTLTYAISQDNNHASSEAAALFIGGSWLESQEPGRGFRWYCLGRKTLEKVVKRLTGDDGSFSQYSINYHRVFLDTLCMVEVWRRRLNLKQFSAGFYFKATKASLFLASIVDPQTGDTPNIGANDGARLLPITDSNYRDYRPTVQLALILFHKKRAYQEKGFWDLPLHWLGLPSDFPVLSPKELKDTLYTEGGYALMRQENAMALLRYPHFQFRPSQADALHVDLWVKGENILRDAGSYSYHSPKPWEDYFPGTVSHNTVEFDNRDQMPKLGRFLFGAWLKTKARSEFIISDEAKSFEASYQDYYGAFHSRKLELKSCHLKVYDEIKGFVSHAILRWRLKPGDWQINNHTLSNGDQQIHITSSAPIVRFELQEGWESRYYLEKSTLPVLEIQVSEPCTLITEYSW